MSRVGKLPVEIPAAVTIEIASDSVSVKGPKGELTTNLTKDVIVTVEGAQLLVKPANDGKRSRAMWGTVRSNVQNLVTGVTDGFVKNLEVRGVGYRCAVAGDILTLFLGYSHDIKYVIPKGVTIAVEKQTLLTISGADKQQVGHVASELRALRKPEPYKGKGVRYADEYVRMKEGKKK